ncbi:MAG: YchF/TatD family DNA exonuclease [Deltaproteobacteria bacterium]|nr:YchF/TatD family DNA exonuclease [Deltaproteobacteria bacterium]
MFVDTHAHIDFSSYSKEEIPEIIKRATEAGVENIIHIASGEGTQSFEGAWDIIDTYDHIYAAVGVHPHDAKEVDEAVLERIKDLARHPKIKAIGEVGLDFHYNHSPADKQKEVLRQFIHLAKELKKPIIIHDRDSHEEILNILKEEKAHEVGGVFHCFSGDYKFGKRVLDENFLVSFTGIVTFKKADQTQEAAQKLPLEKMMIETDSPFLTPVPFRGKRNEPAYVKHVAEKIAELKGLSLEDIGRVTSLNARRLFRFGEQKPQTSLAYILRNSLYLNITNRCTLACVFCPKFVDWEVKGHYLKLKGEPSFEELVQAIGESKNYDEVVFCGYGEPTQRLDMLKKIAAYLHEKGKKVRLDTDGLGNLIHGRNILPELQGLIDSVNVSLNAENAETYIKVCPNRYGKEAYPAVKDFIKEAKKYIPWVQASVVGHPEVNIKASQKVAEEELGVLFRHREYNNVG